MQFKNANIGKHIMQQR